MLDWPHFTSDWHLEDPPRLAELRQEAQGVAAEEDENRQEGHRTEIGEQGHAAGEAAAEQDQEHGGNPEQAGHEVEAHEGPPVAGQQLLAQQGPGGGGAQVPLVHDGHHEVAEQEPDDGEGHGAQEEGATAHQQPCDGRGSEGAGMDVGQGEEDPKTAADDEQRKPSKHEHQPETEELIPKVPEAGPGFHDLRPIPDHAVQEHELAAAAEPDQDGGERQDAEEEQHT